MKLKLGGQAVVLYFKFEISAFVGIRIGLAGSVLARPLLSR